LNPHLRFDIDYILRHIPDFGPALVWTLGVFFASLVVAFLGGILLAIARQTRGPIYWAATFYIEALRNTPSLLHLFFIFFGLPLVGIIWSPFVCGVVALSAQHSAFFAEIFRGTIQSLSRHQREAGWALGLLPSKVMRYIILPQAIRNAIPATGNQLVMLLHDTALVSAIGITEITLTARSLAERSAASFEMFVTIGIIYLALSSILSFSTWVLERIFRYER
jgi:His/Glu/Gln/Arg/opine family amino acid ABC transporter permease subunit